MLELFFIFIRQPDDDFPQWRGKLSEKNKKKKNVSCWKCYRIKDGG